jgi:hypothetical protein
MLSISSVLAAVFSNFELTLDETDHERMEWRDQTLLVNKSRIMAFVTPVNLSASLQEPATVILPDLFVSWAATPIKLNPLYAIEAPRAELWFKEYVPLPKAKPFFPLTHYQLSEPANTTRKCTRNI